MAFIPFIGLASSLFKSIERGVNSAQHNFKSDLSDLLRQAGVPEDLIGRIKQLLNTGTDEEIGPKVNALMAANLIPPELQDSIGELARKNGVPRSSLDQSQLGDPVSREDRRGMLGGAFSDELDAIEAEEDEEEDEENEDEDDDALI